ncbi:HD domain-containing protein [uncultured Desulfobulbus sp.]|uniref:HD domain-containing protein n=1 Tax=uncultured Desulfobulbus sp. TaxID=239745 RepID=UPI0029C97828|nr:HD domain-containing protein [uncultured Desulfobulbus sp.]
MLDHCGIKSGPEHQQTAPHHTMLLATELILTITRQLPINRRGLHGLAHWARVYENGRRLAERTGAAPEVVALFALFHDSRRFNEHADPEHGPRGAMLAEQLRGTSFQLDDEPFALLLTACRLHTGARTHENITVQTCFDADRLDLGRIGKTVDPQFLCTQAARNPQIIEWATAQSIAAIIPENVIGNTLRSLE